MEFRRPRGIATFLWYPLKDGTGIHVSGVTGITPQYATHTDGTAPNNKFSNLAGGVVEIGTSGVYYTSLTATEMANDYIFVIASPTAGSARRADLVINCTAVASVTNVGSVTYAVPLNWASITGATTAQNLSGTQVASINNPVPVNWASVTNPSATNLLSGTTVASVTNPVFLNWAQISNQGAAVNLTATQIASVNYGVGINWGSVTNPGATNNLTLTSIASVNNPVALNWASISNTSATQNFTGATVATVSGVTSSVAPDWGRVQNQGTIVTLTGTTIASISNPVPLLWSSITSPGAIENLSGTSIATVSFATVGGVSTVTGVTNTVQANVILWQSVAPNVLTGGRVDSYAAVLNWASVTAPSTTVGLTGTTVGTLTNLANNAITAAAIADGAIDRATFAVDTGLQTARSDTLAFGGVNSVTLDAGASAVDDFYKDMLIVITGGTGVGQVRLIKQYVGVTQLAVTSPGFKTAPITGSTYAILNVGRIDVGMWGGDVVNPLIAGRVDANSQVVGDKTDYGVNWASISNQGTIVTLTGTMIATVNNPVPLLWSSITSVAAANNFTGTQIASINNPAPINWASVTNPTTALSLSGTIIGTATDVGQTAADHIIDTNLALGGRGNTRNVQNALRLLRNDRSLIFGAMNTATLTVTQEDDSTTAWTAIISTGSTIGLTEINPT